MLIQTWILGNFAFSCKSITLKVKINMHFLHSIVWSSFPKYLEIFTEVQIRDIFHAMTLSPKYLIRNKILRQNSNNSIIILIYLKWNFMQMFALTAKSCCYRIYSLYWLIISGCVSCPLMRFWPYLLLKISLLSKAVILLNGFSNAWGVILGNIGYTSQCATLYCMCVLLLSDFIL